MSMIYEAWRISFQSSEQAARSAYDQLTAAQEHIKQLEESKANLRSQLYQEQQDHKNNVKQIKDIAYMTLNTINDERDALLDDNTQLREFALFVAQYSRIWGGEAERFTEMAEKALSATHAQNLTQIKK